MIRQETKILKHLVHNDEYTRKVLPFLKEEYFSNDGERVIFNIIDDYVKKYNSNPSLDAIAINLLDIKLNEVQKEDIDIILNDIKDPHDENFEWLIDSTEQFCKEKALWNGIMDSVAILEEKDKNRSKESIPQILQDALAVCFDPSIGHDYVEDYEERFDFYHSDVQRIPFDIELLNKITKGGLPNKSLSILIAGCVHPETSVKVLVEEVELTVPIKNVRLYLKQNKKVLIDSPDGYVKVKKYVSKGQHEEYYLGLDDGRYVRCNGDHLFETTFGWQYAKDIALLGIEQHFLTDDGYVLGFVNKIEGSMIPIVDVEVDHDNRRYYTNGISSHNTGVGKSISMCHFASAVLMQGKNVLYITLEMAEEKIAERIDANLLDVDINKITDISRDIYSNKITNIQRKTSGKLIIKEYPPSTAHAGHFKHLLSELKIKKKFIPDIIFVDYINICASQRYKAGGNINSYNYFKAVSEELRAIAVEFNVPLVSATQVNRTGFSSNDIDMEDTSESFGMNFTADLILALMSNEELEKLNQVIFKQIKNRYNDVNYYKKFVVGIDRPKMRLFDCESDANREIKAERKESVAKDIFVDLTKNNKSRFSNIKT